MSSETSHYSTSTKTIVRKREVYNNITVNSNHDPTNNSITSNSMEGGEGGRPSKFRRVSMDNAVVAVVADADTSADTISSSSSSSSKSHNTNKQDPNVASKFSSSSSSSSNLSLSSFSVDEQNNKVKPSPQQKQQQNHRSVPTTLKRRITLDEQGFEQQHSHPHPQRSCKKQKSTTTSTTTTTTNTNSSPNNTMKTLLSKDKSSSSLQQEFPNHHHQKQHEEHQGSNNDEYHHHCNCSNNNTEATLRMTSADATTTTTTFTSLITPHTSSLQLSGVVADSSSSNSEDNDDRSTLSKDSKTKEEEEEEVGLDITSSSPSLSSYGTPPPMMEGIDDVYTPTTPPTTTTTTIRVPINYDQTTKESCAEITTKKEHQQPKKTLGWKSMLFLQIGLQIAMVMGKMIYTQSSNRIIFTAPRTTKVVTATTRNHHHYDYNYNHTHDYSNHQNEIIAATTSKNNNIDINNNNNNMIDDNNDCIYVPGGGFSGFWFILGRLQSIPNPYERNFVCYSAGCLGTVVTLSHKNNNLTMEALYHSASTIQQEWRDGKRTRYSIVESFIDDLIDKATATEYSKSILLNALPQIHILTSVVVSNNNNNHTDGNDGNNGGFLFEARMEQPTDLWHLKKLLLQSTWIPLAVGSHFSHQGHLDGGFSAWQHPKCKDHVGLAWDVPLLLNVLNPNIGPEMVNKFWNLGLEYGL